ncbi:PQQ-binding-like beta-propeller repeat protein [candidate division KSB1 bacterium]|nr:PQQ-binding-like beta-propeller repeat protein [candidate division KSB1 bacterium]
MTKRRGAFLVVVVYLFCSFFKLNAQNWPMVNGDRGRSSWAELAELSPPLENAQHFSLDNGIASGLSCYENMFFVSVEADPNRVLAFDADNGVELWRFEIPETHGSVNVVPAVNASLVLCGGQGGLGLYALDRLTGAEKWFQSIGDLYSKNPIIDGERVYVVSDMLYCLDISDGETIWSFPFSANVTPAVDDENVYVCGNRQLIAFNKVNGEIAWQIENSQRSYSSVAVDENFVYTAHKDSILAVAKETGSVHWSFHIPDGILPDLSANAMAISDSSLCFSIWENSDKRGQLYALDKMTGYYRWHHTFDTTGVYSPTIANGNVYAINWQTNSIWGFHLQTGQHIFFDASAKYLHQPIVAQNTLFVEAFGAVVSFKSAGTGIQAILPEGEKSFELFPNHPNPFNQSTRFKIHLFRSDHVHISVYNLSGARIKTIADCNFTAGSHAFIWDGTDDRHHTVPSGVYIARLCTGSSAKSIKMILIR